MRVVGHQVDEHLHLVGEHRRQRLHALHRVPVGDLLGDLGQLRVLLAQLLGPGPHLVGQQQLAARRRPQPGHRLEGALVGDRERPDLLDLVAPELHPQRVLLGRREDVDDARRGPRTRRASPPGPPGSTPRPPAVVRRRRARPRSPTDSSTGSRSARPRTWGCSTERTGATTTRSGPFEASSPGCRSRRSTASRRPDGVAARRQPLVRQRLPRRVVGHQVRVDDALQGTDQALGLPGGRGDGQHGAAGVHEALDDERAQRARRGEVQRRRRAGPGVRHRRGERRVGQDQIRQALHAQRRLPCCGTGPSTGADRPGPVCSEGMSQSTALPADGSRCPTRPTRAC